MNLKEAFRYQNFLDRIFGAACVSIEKRDHCLTQTRNHLYNKVNPDMENVKALAKALLKYVLEAGTAPARDDMTVLVGALRRR